MASYRPAGTRIRFQRGWTYTRQYDIGVRGGITGGSLKIRYPEQINGGPLFSWLVRISPRKYLFEAARSKPVNPNYT